MINWSYIAGFFDGEGCIGTRGGLFPKVSITQTNEEVLSLIQQFLVTHGIVSYLYLHRVSASHLGKKPCFVLEVTRRDSVSAFLKNTLPYLHVKRQKAMDAVRYLTLYPDLKFLCTPKGKKFANLKGI